VQLSDYDYILPPERIAQTPAEPRDSARLMLLDRDTGAIGHTIFRRITDYLRPGDMLVINDTRVIPARMYANKTATGGRVEVLLLRKQGEKRWRAIVGGRRVLPGTRLTFGNGRLVAEVVGAGSEAERILEFERPITDDDFEALGEIPLPPYITQSAPAERYQTVYAREAGSAAAPTAGLHFTPELLLALREHGIGIATCTLHIGLGTFQPVKASLITEHTMHHESASLNDANARAINEAKLAGGRIIAVGTTAARTLETAGILSEGGDPAEPARPAEACPWRPVMAFESDTNLFIYPGYRWRVVDGLITNFHLPRSTLLMMIAALAGRDAVLDAYATAVAMEYRFFSFGDAMFIARHGMVAI
jgi:S-adenosylmethionine:tRNA ribosyltransferase-isomerase